MRKTLVEMSESESGNSEYEAGSGLQSEDDTSELLDDFQQTGNFENDILQLELLNECEVETKLEITAAGNWDVKKLSHRYKYVFETAVKLRFEDITSLSVEGNVFLVCGDSLLMNATRNGYSSRFGGQSLHLVYLCERLLQLFQRKGAMFEIVFFDVWKDILVDESYSLARTILMAHIRKNTPFSIHCFHATWDPSFTSFIDMCKPSFLLLDLMLPSTYLSLREDCNVSLVKPLLHAQVLHAVSLNLRCATMEEVEVNVSTIHTFTAEGSPFLKKILPFLLTYLQSALADSVDPPRVQNSVEFEGSADIRHVVTVMAASSYLTEEQNKSSRDWIRAFLLYSATLEVLPLRNRACPFPRETPSPELMAFVKSIQSHMQYLLECLNGSSYSHLKVADLWHGHLFVSILRHLHSVPQDSLDLGPQTAEIYLHFTEEVSRVSGIKLEAFPVLKRSLNWHKEDSLSPDVSKQGQVPPVGFDLERLIPTSCNLSREFCGALWSEVEQQALQYDDRMNAFIVRHSQFSEIRHWHSRKPLTDEQDRIRNNTVMPKDDWAKQKYDYFRKKFAKFMDIYGASIEGRKNISETIVSRQQTKSKKNSKKERESQKAVKIKEANLEKKRLEVREKEGQDLKKFKETFKKMKSRGNYAAALEEAKLLRKRLLFPESIQQVDFFIARSCYLLWCEECLAARSQAGRDLSYAKELFLSFRQILQGSSDSRQLSDLDKEEIGKWLWHLGFGEMASHLNVPRPASVPETFHVGLSWVRFQLLHLGPDLQRSSDGSPDKRVDFIPDKWQSDLFDIIDRRESAVIVAPTSSGKTYASYYCMETILREDDEGVIVYVSPTKALVNQVAATVYSRFKRKDMPEGKAVYGILTRDYRMNDMNCQILVTVPQCLELLLMSPRTQAWVRKLRYVIFDEIHCLAGQAGGLSWESSLLMIRCPFLALSATIGNPDTMRKWLQSAENFKKERDTLDGCLRPSAKNRDPYRVHLIEHHERHSDLKKYVYTPSKELIHIHPYAYIDETVIKEHKGIPHHISLAPEESLQLYCAMEAVSQNDKQVLALRPEVHFRSQSFLKRSCVRNYESELKAVVQEWALQDHSHFNALITHLRSPLESARNEESDFRFANEHFLNLIEMLRKKQMFPSILFRYDKSELDYLFRVFIEHCRSLERRNDRSDNLRKQNDVGDKKEKRLKTLYQSSEQGGNLLKKVPKSLKRRERPDRGSLGLLEDSSYGSIRNVGFADEGDVKFIEQRLIVSGCKKNDIFPCGLRLGLGKHHAAMTAKEKSAVEMLFRMRVLNAVLATGTLALGIHMPCKTVVIGGNSPFINTLSYHQMSGRSGRRGYDTEGNVVFFGMGERKIRTLLTGKLPSMIGNFPLTVTMVLRLLLLVSDVTEKDVHIDEAQKNALSRALMFLNCNLVYQRIPELKDQMKHFFAFSSQLLMLHGLLDDKGKPQKLCSLVTHLHYHEPGNLVLAYLLRSGALRRLCVKGNDKDKELKLVLLLSHLFARQPLHSSALERDYDNSIVLLPDLPEDVIQDIHHYNEEVKYIYNHYFRCVAANITRRFGEDNTLPLSGVSFELPQSPMYDAETSHLEATLVTENTPRNICSRFVALSGHSDKTLYSRTRMIPNIRHGVFTDVKVVPLLDCSIQLNAYAWDFYNHGILSAIVRDNGIKLGDAFTLLQDFMLMLKTVFLSVEELGIGEEDDPVIQTFRNVKDKFHAKFNKAFCIMEKF